MGEISSPEEAVLAKIEPIAATDIERSGEAYLHRSLRAGQFGTPHAEVGAVPRFDPVHGKGDTIEGTLKLGEGAAQKQLPWSAKIVQRAAGKQ